MIYTIGTVIALFLSLTLFSKRKSIGSKADNILAIWLFITGMDILLNYLFLSDKYHEFPFFLGFEAPLPLFQGPLLFLYTAELTKTVLPRNTRWMHFILPFSWYILFANFLSMPLDYKIKVCQESGAGHELLVNSTSWAIKTSGVIYVVISLWLIGKYQMHLKNNFSYTEKLNLHWLVFLVLGLAFIWCMVLFSHDGHRYSVMAIYVFFIGYFGVKNLGIFTNPTSLAQEAKQIKIEASEKNETPIIPKALNRYLDGTQDQPAKTIKDKIISDNIDRVNREYETDVHPAHKKYLKSGLSDEDGLRLHQQLSEIMQQEKLYKNPELTLVELADRLSIGTNNLSQVINHFEKKNFYDFINCLRVAYFLHLVSLPENQRYTLLSLAYDAGFNSKTTFNRNFKKVTGLSPSEYLQQNND